ncbi:MAG: PilZ domain-containing protein [Gallionella sp.]|nr:PilZ domain-containing protein [Gallionella sp.]
MGKSENDPLGVLGAIGDISPVYSLPPRGKKELRNETRYMASWRAAVSVEGRDFHYGRIRDISLHGTAILSGLNIKDGTGVTLNIHIPALTTPCASKVLIVRGIASYAVHDVDHQCFRVGITFVEFEPAEDRTYLEERLTNHHAKVADYVCRRSTD